MFAQRWVLRRARRRRWTSSGDAQSVRWWMAIARANGKLKGKQPKLSARQRAHVLNLVRDGDHTIADLAELFAVSRATIYREIARARPLQTVR